MIDFSALVLGPAMAVFGQPIRVTPTKSQPGEGAYAATGVYSLKPVEEQLEGSELFHQTAQPALGIKLASFVVPPVQGDAITMAQGSFLVSNVIPDGQGGAVLMLRRTS